MAGLFNTQSMSNLSESIAWFPAKLRGLFEPHRYKIAYGGRGSGKSWAMARALLIQAAQTPMRVLCAREVQKSIKQSVHTLLVDQIQGLELGYFYSVTETEIRGINGSSFSFAGLAQHTVESIKSYENISRVWIEEGQTVSKKSWDILIPTIRAPGSEIWVSFNPDLDTDETYVRFVENTPPDSFIVKINYSDNKWFPSELEKERAHCEAHYPKDYPNIWLGNPKTVVDGAIYADEYQQMLDEHRITRVGHDPVLKVHAVFDMGYSDAMAVIIVQKVASECRIINYIERTHAKNSDISEQLKRMPYTNWGKLWLPHDANYRERKVGMSDYEMFTSMGWDCEVLPMGSVDGGIKRVRELFPRVWMDKENTRRLQECLKRYRFKFNQSTQKFDEPLHDEYSHGADAFRYLATCIHQMRNEPYKKRRDEYQGAGSWMSA